MGSPTARVQFAIAAIARSNFLRAWFPSVQMKKFKTMYNNIVVPFTT